MQKIKKIEMNKTLRIIIITVLLLISSILFYRVMTTRNTENFQEKTELIYSHQWEEEISWQSKLIANDFFQERILDKSRFIFKDLTESITVEFMIPIYVSEKAVFEGDMVLVGSLKSVYGTEKELVWEKSVVIQEGNMAVSGQEIQLSSKRTENIMIIKNELIELEETYAIPGSYILEYEFKVDGIIKTENDTYPFKVNPKVQYSIMDDLTKGEEIKSDAFEYTKEETILIPIEVEDNSTMYYGLILAMFLVMILILLFTKSKDRKDDFDRLVSNLLKEYKDRMVEIPRSLSLQYGNVMTIENEIDMIKTADEINQPVFYYYSNEAEERKLEMFIFDDVRVYYYSKFGVSQ